MIVARSNAPAPTGIDAGLRQARQFLAPSDQPRRSASATALMVGCFICLIWTIVARLVGPSDMFDQTQPKTVSYTTDIIVHGGERWILPLERAELTATKPPLYNWLAVPAVWMMGFNSEIAHKLPSLIALCLCWAAAIGLGRRLDEQMGGDGTLGWLTGIIVASNYLMFKLGYLARPDMLLTLVMFGAWIAATFAMIQARQTHDTTDLPQDRTSRVRLAAAIFWACLILAALSKGPVAFVGMLYAVLAAIIIGGSWRSIGSLRPWIGLPAFCLFVGAWLYAAWRINPGHVRDELWFNEFFGRVTGLGPEGTQTSRTWFVALADQWGYYAIRFFPWSLCSLAALITLGWRAYRRWPTGMSTIRRWRTSWQAMPPQELWLWAALLFVLMVLSLFSLSTGKRADYISLTFPPASILSAWWLLRARPYIAARMAWVPLAAAAIVMTGMTVENQLQTMSPQRGFGPAIRSFIDQSAAAIDAEPLPIIFHNAGESQLQAMLGCSQLDTRGDMDAMLKQRASFWLISGRRAMPPFDLAAHIAERRRRTRFEPVVVSALLPRVRGWPEQVTLYKVTPIPKKRRPRPPSATRPAGGSTSRPAETLTNSS